MEFQEKDIIGYRPDLNYKKESFSKTEIQTLTENAKKEMETIIKSSPSNTIKGLESVIRNVDSLINKIIDNSTDKDLRTFYAAILLKKDDYVKNALESNDTIDGETSYEVLFLMNIAKDNLKSVVNTLKTLYYGDENISLEQQEEKDAMIFQSILSKDGTESSFGIKYNLLYTDAILNKSIENTGYFINKVVIGFPKTIESGTSTSVDSSNSLILNKLFDETKTKDDDRTAAFTKQLERNLAEKTLFNYYEKRKELIQMDQLCVQSGTEIALFQNELEKKQSEVSNSVKEISKYMLYIQTQLKLFEPLLKSKEQLRKIYKQLTD